MAAVRARAFPGMKQVSDVKVSVNVNVITVGIINIIVCFVLMK